MGAHDSGYKQLFSFPAMVEDLLRGFVREKWVDALDFTTLERKNGSYVSDDLREREAAVGLGLRQELEDAVQVRVPPLRGHAGRRARAGDESHEAALQHRLPGRAAGWPRRAVLERRLRVGPPYSH